MNKTYYGTLDEFVRSSKNHNLKIIVGKKANIFELSNKNASVKATYKEIVTNNRSFSLPFFSNIGLSLDFEETTELDLLNKIEYICQEYTDAEIGAIKRDMPILDNYASSHLGELCNIAIIWRDHFLEENVGLLSAFIKMGVNPTNILALDKGDKTLHQNNIKNTLAKLEMNVDILDNSIVADIDKKPKYKNIIYDFIESHKGNKFLIIDDGAIITKILNNKFYPNILAIIELTEMGLRRIRLIENKLMYPVLNVAKTFLKRQITYPEIANSIFLRILELVGGEKMVGRNVLLLGYGDMGEVLADRMRSFGIRVNIFDPDIMRLIVAAEKGYSTFTDPLVAIKNTQPVLIIGASGYESITDEMVKALPERCFITAGATADLLIFKKYKEAGLPVNIIPNVGSQYKVYGKEINILGNGRSVNLFESEAIPNRANDIFKSATLITARNCVKNEIALKHSLNLNIVEQWIRESGVLEMYYNLYLK